VSEREGNPILTVGQIRAERGLAMFVEGVLVQHAGRIVEGLRATGMVDPALGQRVLLKVSTRLFDIAPQNGEAERGESVELVREAPVRVEEPGEARRLGPGKKAKARKRPAKRAAQQEEAEEMPTCPICGVRLTKKDAIGCTKHWREVRRRMEPGWEDERKGRG